MRSLFMKIVSSLVLPIAAIFIALISISPETAARNLSEWAKVFGLKALGAYLADPERGALYASVGVMGLIFLVAGIAVYTQTHGEPDSRYRDTMNEMFDLMDRRRNGQP